MSGQALKRELKVPPAMATKITEIGTLRAAELIQKALIDGHTQKFVGAAMEDAHEYVVKLGATIYDLGVLTGDIETLNGARVIPKEMKAVREKLEELRGNGEEITRLEEKLANVPENTDSLVQTRAEILEKISANTDRIESLSAQEKRAAELKKYIVAQAFMEEKEYVTKENVELRAQAEDIQENQIPAMQKKIDAAKPDRERLTQLRQRNSKLEQEGLGIKLSELQSELEQKKEERTRLVEQITALEKEGVYETVIDTILGNAATKLDLTPATVAQVTGAPVLDMNDLIRQFVGMLEANGFAIVPRDTQANILARLGVLEGEVEGLQRSVTFAQNIQSLIRVSEEVRPFGPAEPAGQAEELPSAESEVVVRLRPLEIPADVSALSPGEATVADVLSTPRRTSAPTVLPDAEGVEAILRAAPGRVDLKGLGDSPAPESRRTPTPLPVDAMTLLATAQGNLTSEVGKRALIDFVTAVDAGTIDLNALPPESADTLNALACAGGKVGPVAEKLCKALFEDGVEPGNLAAKLR